MPITTLSPTQSNILAALKSFLAEVLPPGYVIVTGQGNYVPEPQSPSFCVMTPMRFERLETNYDDWADVQFTASISGTVMTVSAVQFGTIFQGATVFGSSVAANTLVGTQITGAPGGPGTYQVSVSQAASPQTMASGALFIVQGAMATIQIDFHSSDLTSADAAQTVSTLFRDEYATSFFAGLAPPLNGVAPLYADDPRQNPFINAEDLFEYRWILEARLQANQVVSVPQQFFTSAVVVPVSVEATYPP